MTILMMTLMMILMMILVMVGAGTEDRSQEEPYTFRPLHPGPPPVPPSAPQGGVQISKILDPVWEREKERVNRDALTRLKTSGGVGGFL